ncbi:MAG: metallophosphoesterase [Spirochaetales bacterium]|nr:metallophosphoesterase [Spirochaetales bacterium]
MTIAYTSDLHVDSSKENARIPQAILRILKEKKPDVFIITGDICHSLKTLEEVLSIFKSLSCTKLFVPGNHDIWAHGEYTNSYIKYYDLLPKAAKKNDFIPVWIEPYVTGDYGFCGSMGWYDYSFKPENLNISENIYKEKIYEGYTWMDKIYAIFINDEKVISDKDITMLLYKNFIEQYREISKNVKKIITLFHHVPFREMILHRKYPVWNFFATYMGSDCFGDFLIESKKIELVLYGHSHIKQQKKIIRPTMTHPFTVVSSPFGYFRSEGLRPESRWHRERLSFIEV